MHMKQCLINKREKVGWKHYDDPIAFIEYSHDMQDIEILKSINNFIIVFEDIIADMIGIKKLHPIVTELFIRSWKSNISIVFIM